MNKDSIKILLGDCSYMVKEDNQLMSEYEGYKVSFLVRPLIKKGGINILGAERSSGKTRLSCQIAYSLAYEAKEVIGYSIEEFGPVLYINLEQSEADFKTFLHGCENYFIHQGCIKKHAIKTVSFIDNLGLKFNNILNIVEDTKPFLIIIDGYKMLSSLYSADRGIANLENQHIAEFYTELRKWLEASPGSSILLTNHTNKGNSQDPTHGDMLYGPGALQDYADQVCLIRKTRSDNERLLIPTKTRFSDEAEAGINLFKIRSNEDNSQVWPELIQPDVLEKDHRGKENANYNKEQREQARLMVEAGIPMSEIAFKVGGPGMSKGTISKWAKNGFK